MSIDRTFELLGYLYGQNNVQINKNPMKFIIRNKTIESKTIDMDDDHNLFYIVYNGEQKIFHFDRQKGLIEMMYASRITNTCVVSHPYYGTHDIPHGDVNYGIYFDLENLFDSKELYGQVYTTVGFINNILDNEWKKVSDNIARKYMLFRETMHKDVVNCIIGKLCLLGYYAKI